MLDSPARPVPAATAAASASAASSCTVPDSDPKILHLVAPVYTEAIRERHKTGVVDVTVFLASDGAISKAAVSLSSGDDLLDAATYTAATATTYAPEVKGCTYLAGTYIFRARFRAEPKAAPDPTVTEKPPFAPAASASPQSSPPPAH